MGLLSLLTGIFVGMGVGAKGLAVGKAEGPRDGFTLGAEVGWSGDLVGPRDGALEGTSVGKPLGLKEVDVALGEEEGLPEGSIVNTEGWPDGWP